MKVLDFLLGQITKLDCFHNPKFRVNIDESYLTTDRVFVPNKIMNLSIVFEIKSWSCFTDEILP